ncbi:uncharacterized protein LOC127966536 isoform X2 [Carassius gibelio]|uniref:uncharacterized protein LOC127966536 isoform X1 n=1 Tax=Carassius gibelio TaxID=101364 RepID=UPI0022780C7B|nr:uncharacterized protein LOC127966536 isoform X1 [Carassius gibelio]XP_052423548.1 uncharacterized protein LOC127966536 isoform X2 [Carassius gibelio]
MISTRTVCFVYFALLFGSAHADGPANEITTTNTTVPEGDNNSIKTESTSMTMVTNVSLKTTNNNRDSSKLTSSNTVCTPATSKPKEGHCILFLPTNTHSLPLIAAALTVGCLALLLTTLICACQVCHLRGIISSLQSRYDSIDRHARREKSESPCRDECQVDRHPTETCFLLSEVTTAQEEREEDQENKTEEKNDTEQPSTEPPVMDPNGDITQENSPESDAKAPESPDTGE